MLVTTRAKQQQDRIKELAAKANGDAGADADPADAAPPADPPAQANPQEPPSGDPAKPELKLTPIDPEKSGTDRSIDYRAKFMALEGKYKAEVPRLHTEIRGLKQDLEAANRQIEELKAGQASLSADPDASEPFTKLREELGEDLGGALESAVTASHASLNGEVATIKQSMETLTKTLEKYGENLDRQAAQSEQAAQVQFFEGLDKQVPLWEQIYHSQEFVEWAKGVNPLSESGSTYDETINRAFAGFNLSPIVNVFNAFLKSVGFEPTTPNVNEQIVPASKGGGGDKPIGEVRRWTRQEIDRFQNDVRAGKYRGKDEEVARITREIQKSLTARE